MSLSATAVQAKEIFEQISELEAQLNELLSPTINVGMPAKRKYTKHKIKEKIQVDPDPLLDEAFKPEPPKIDGRGKADRTWPLICKSCSEVFKFMGRSMEGAVCPKCGGREVRFNRKTDGWHGKPKDEVAAKNFVEDEPEEDPLRCGDCEYRFTGVLLDAVCSKCGSNSIYRFYE